LFRLARTPGAAGCGRLAKWPLMDSCLVAYDIADPKRLRKAATTCEDFGERKLFSVF
jgi:hypothetical protein